MKTSIFWFTCDFRLAANPALAAAFKADQVLPIYIFEPKEALLESKDTSSFAWRLQALENLSNSMEGCLNFYQGRPEVVLPLLCKRFEVESVFCGRIYEPKADSEVQEVAERLQRIGIEFQALQGRLLKEPAETVKVDGSPYLVFTPFYKANYQSFDLEGFLPSKPSLKKFIKDAESKELVDFEFFNNKGNFKGVGEAAAQKKFSSFFQSRLASYSKKRDFPQEDSTSDLSAALHFGHISPAQIVEKVDSANGLPAAEKAAFLRQLAWREFCYSTLHFFPDMDRKNINKKMDRFDWGRDKNLLKVWKEGRTGYPFVDAGMRELLQTGRMHNRVRMVVASFLVKNLKVHWALGAEYFMEKLLDADLAANSFNWQWVAGTGLDAAPFFRIFNPTLQGKKFDPEGLYTRKFVEELKAMPDKYLFEPWLASKIVLEKAGVLIGRDYPEPVVDLVRSRKEALDGYKRIG